MKEPPTARPFAALSDEELSKLNDALSLMEHEQLEAAKKKPVEPGRLGAAQSTWVLWRKVADEQDRRDRPESARRVTELEEQLARVRGLVQRWKVEYHPSECQWDACTVIEELELALDGRTGEAPTAWKVHRDKP
jgi:hypothetical protein